MTDREFDRIAARAALLLQPREKREARAYLEQMLRYVGRLPEAGAQAEPARPFPEEGPESWRQDEPQAYPGRELLELAEEVRDGCYAAGLAVDGND